MMAVARNLIFVEHLVASLVGKVSDKTRDKGVFMSLTLF